MAQIGPSQWVDMGHQIQDAMALQDPLPRRDGNVVAGFDADRSVDLEVRIDNNHVAHLARTNVVDAYDARCFVQRTADGRDLLLVHGAIHDMDKAPWTAEALRINNQA